ncbi:MAG: 30S ribosomal protein S6 [Candidatus Pacebacteria bacterium]|nr:30S ribosomal protein S6 [Candidatus Paceibacterota bacterium]
MPDTHEDMVAEEVELQQYELGYHLVPSLSEDDLALRVGELMQVITNAGGKIVSEGAPQACTLTYTMKRLRGGRWEKYDTTFFGWVRFSAPAEVVLALKEVLEHAEYVVRHLILKLDAKALAPAPTPRVPRPTEVVEVAIEPKQLESKHDEETKVDVSEEELDKQIEDLIK